VELASAGVPLVETTRGERVESVHLGVVGVVDAPGRLEWSAGDGAGEMTAVGRRRDRPE
jgi:L-asparaginase II